MAKKTPVTAPGEHLRVETACQRPVRGDGRFVVYWMTAARRPKWNFGLERAVDWARHLKAGLLVVETVPCGDRWDNRRRHWFAMQGMADNLEYFSKAGRGRYYPYVARRPGEERALLAALAREACLVVTDQFPIRRWREALDYVAGNSPVRVEAVDSCGLVPMRAAEKAFTLAHVFRRFWQRLAPELLLEAPAVEPLARGRLPSVAMPREIERSWPALVSKDLADPGKLLDRLPIDQVVGEVPTRGGWREAQRRLRLFLDQKLDHYPEDRNQPEAEATSSLSPYLHFGHVSAQEVVYALNRREAGPREQWWAVSPSAAVFLDQLITWREVGFNFCRFREDYDRFESLPEWVRRTLAKHAPDRRPETYSAAELEAARTGDRLWNAAQMQLVREGRVHNYLRMLWGKKIFQWSASPEAALEVMTELNNRYALDGCDPNSYSGIFWILGRYDRPWGPERPIFGSVRYMTSENTARKHRVKKYLEKYAL